MISYSNQQTRHVALLPVNMDLSGMKELAGKFYVFSKRFELLPDFKRKEFMQSVNLINQFSLLKSGIFDLLRTDEKCNSDVNLDQFDLIITPAKILYYGYIVDIEKISRILIHDRFIGTSRCWLKKENK